MVLSGSRWPRRWVVLAAAVAMAVIGLVLLREPFGRWLFPDAAVAGLVAQAEHALDAGDVVAAAVHFQAAQARSPDHPRVADGLAETRERLLIKVSQALASDALDEARGHLALAAQLGAPGDRLVALERAIEERAEPSIEALLRRAVESEGIDPYTALLDYRSVLQRDPRNAVARSGQSRLLAAKLAEAEAALGRGDAALAAHLVQRVREIDPAHLKLPELAERLGALPLSAVVVDTEAAPSPEAARWRGLAEEALGRGAVNEARRALDHARALDPDAPQQAALEIRWQRAKSEPAH